MKTIAKWPILALIIIPLWGCPQDTAVWVDAGSTADDLTLIFGRERGVQEPIEIMGLRIDECRAVAAKGRYPAPDSAVWALEVSTAASPSISNLQYGEAPTGFSALGPAPELQNSECYLVTISGTGRTAFEIDANGEITELTDSQMRDRQM